MSQIWVVATQIFWILHPYIWEMIQFDEHIFEMGSETVHQLEIIYTIW